MSVPFSAGLLADATVTIVQTAGSTTVPEAACRLDVPGATGVAINQRVTFNGTAAGEFEQVTLTRATDSRPAGTYDVNVICTSAAATGHIAYQAGSLTAHAAAG